jgi:N-terminal acetyltransferase B complex non-catalytic subunit
LQTADQLVKAFQYERYSQVAEFVLLDEKIENSFQRDLTKLEHFRMKNLHEGLTPESVEVELVELRFVWGRGTIVSFINHEF